MGRLRAAAAEPGPGDVVDGRFELVEVIGEGGMGLVWSALDRDQGRQIALKIVTAEGADTDGRLQREADAMSRLSHPAIVRTFAVGAAGSVRYVAMELLEGCTLADRLGQGPLPIGETVAIGRRVAGALACMHETGLVHRDIKPANVFLVYGSTATAKLLDFGLVRAVEGDKVTKTGTIVGTPGYMAPEQLRDSKHVDARTDIGSIGVVLHELLTGESPFGGTAQPPWGLGSPAHLPSRCVRFCPRLPRRSNESSFAVSTRILPPATAMSPPSDVRCFRSLRRRHARRCSGLKRCSVTRGPCRPGPPNMRKSCGQIDWRRPFGPERSFWGWRR